MTAASKGSNCVERAMPVDAVSVTLQPFRPEHIELLAAWLEEPHVVPWYAHPDENLEWAQQPPPGGDHAIIALDARAVGYLRWQRVDRATLDSLGLTDIPENSVDADILVGGAGGFGRGIGPRALNLLARQLLDDPSIPLIGLTSELANTHAHRAFEKAGFHIARQYDAPLLGVCHLLIRELRAERSPARPR
jgi:RimJ/RimL family protein N-acetyltransferase